MTRRLAIAALEHVARCDPSPPRTNGPRWPKERDRNSVRLHTNMQAAAGNRRRFRWPSMCISVCSTTSTARIAWQLH